MSAVKQLQEIPWLVGRSVLTDTVLFYGVVSMAIDQPQHKAS